MAEILASERRFFSKNREQLAAQYDGRFLVIKDNKVHGDYPTLEEAVKNGADLFGAGPFLAMSPTEDEITASVPALTLGIPMTQPCPH